MRRGQEARTLSGDIERAQETRTRSMDRMLGHKREHVPRVARPFLRNVFVTSPHYCMKISWFEFVRHEAGQNYLYFQCGLALVPL